MHYKNSRPDGGPAGRTAGGTTRGPDEAGHGQQVAPRAGAQAMNRVIERQDMVRFTPVGQARELAAVTLRLAAEAIADGDIRLAAAVLDQAQPESADGSAPTVAACIGVVLGLLDQWLLAHDRTPADLGKLTQLPAGHWTGERAAADIVTLARKGRACTGRDPARPAAHLARQSFPIFTHK